MTLEYSHISCELFPLESYSLTDCSIPARQALSLPQHREASLVVDVSKTGCLGLGLRARTERVGPESALVDDFLGDISISHSENHRVFILKEPQIGNAFPDIVVVVYDARVMNSWPIIRMEITTEDLKLMQLIYTNRGASNDELKFFLGKAPAKALARLEASGMIEWKKGKWTTCDLSSIFALHSVLAFEAKMAPTSKVIEQALANKWFATDSSILIPMVGRYSRIAETARRHDLGVYTRQAGGKTSIRPKKHNKPLSYASWMINEWAWRMAALQDV